MPASLRNMLQNRHSSGHDASECRHIRRSVLVGGVFVVHSVGVSGAAPVQGSSFKRPAHRVYTKSAVYAQPTHSAVYFVMVLHPRLDCLNVAFGNNVAVGNVACFKNPTLC